MHLLRFQIQLPPFLAKFRETIRSQTVFVNNVKKSILTDVINQQVVAAGAADPAYVLGERASVSHEALADVEATVRRAQGR